MRTKKLAISLPRDLYDEIEHRRAKSELSRSATIQQMLRALLREEHRQQRIAEYVRAYQEYPETAGEVQLGEAIAAAAWSTPWDAVRKKDRRRS